MSIRYAIGAVIAVVGLALAGCVPVHHGSLAVGYDDGYSRSVHGKTVYVDPTPERVYTHSTYYVNGTPYPYYYKPYSAHDDGINISARVYYPGDDYKHYRYYRPYTTYRSYPTTYRRSYSPKIWSTKRYDDRHRYYRDSSRQHDRDRYSHDNDRRSYRRDDSHSRDNFKSSQRIYDPHRDAGRSLNTGSRFSQTSPGVFKQVEGGRAIVRTR